MTPNTDCPECWRAEATMLQRAMRSLGGLASQPRGTAAVIASFAGDPAKSMAAALGRCPSWYDRHRAAFIATGDRAELDRMARHVR